jgi:methionyl-tRNA formyltransferase
MDAGDILLQERTTIDINEKYSELEHRLAQVGADLLIKTLHSDIPSIRKKQNIADVTFCKKIQNEDGLIDWKKSIFQIHDLVRAIPAYTIVNNKRIKVLETRITNDTLEILTVQPEGKKAMSYEEFKRGYKLELH